MAMASMCIYMESKEPIDGSMQVWIPLDWVCVIQMRLIWRTQNMLFDFLW